MRPTILKVFLYFLNLICLVALGGSIYLIFFTSKINTEPPELKIDSSFASAQNVRYPVGFSTRDIATFDAVFSSPVVAKTEDVPETPEDVKDENEEVTEIDNLVVIGVIFDAQMPEDSLAVIFDRETGEQVNIFTGDEYKGWTLETVLDRVTVMLVKGDSSQKLVKASEAPTANKPSNVQNQPPSSLPSAGSRGNLPNGTIATRNPQPVAKRPNPVRGKKKWNNQVVNGRIKKAFTKRDLKALLKQKNQLMQEVYAKPFLDKGKPIGMQVTTISPNSRLNQFGLQPGDIVTSWNGQPIRSEADCYRILRQYENDIDSLPPRNEIVVIRNGQRVILDVDIK